MYYLQKNAPGLNHFLWTESSTKTSILNPNCPKSNLNLKYIYKYTKYQANSITRLTIIALYSYFLAK